MAKSANRYVQIIEQLFLRHYTEGDDCVQFERSEIIDIAKELSIDLPLNLGDIIYTFRYRGKFPEAILSKSKEGYEWVILPNGKSRYKFALTRIANYLPNQNLVKTKIPDSTPNIVSRYAIDDEQALLAKIRYNRLIDIFTGITCYSLQNHLRTQVKEIGQIETDEIYIGINKNGTHFVFPVQAKGGNDKLGAVQIIQDIALCAEKFPKAICRPIAAQFLNDQAIVLFEFVDSEEGIRIASEKHYQLVPNEDLSDDEVRNYGQVSE